MGFKNILEFSIVSSTLLIFAFAPIIVPSVVLLLSWYWSPMYVLPIWFAYCFWLYIDRHTGCRGGRLSDGLRRCSIWKIWAQYFPLKLFKTTDLDLKQNYIFGYHPHGLGAIGALGNFCTEATGFSHLFPSIRPHLMLLRMQFFNPITRDLLLGLGKN